MRIKKNWLENTPWTLEKRKKKEKRAGQRTRGGINPLGLRNELHNTTRVNITSDIHLHYFPSLIWRFNSCSSSSASKDALVVPAGDDGLRLLDALDASGLFCDLCDDWDDWDDWDACDPPEAFVPPLSPLFCSSWETREMKTVSKEKVQIITLR